MKKLRVYLLSLLIILCPIYVYAYDRVIPGGETIGIEVHSNGVLVVGFYEVNGKKIGKDSGFKIGDTIIKVNDTKVYNISSMMKEVNETRGNNIKFTLIRKQKIK